MRARCQNRRRPHKAGHRLGDQRDPRRVAVDLNPAAVAANAVRNGVADRITFRESDVFSAVDGRFDLMIFGTSGDLAYLYRLIDENGFSRTILASRELVKPEMTVWYHTLRLERDVRG
jgi:release factor glutamine methyltransferase